jgi:hypothetical protein
MPFCWPSRRFNEFSSDRMSAFRAARGFGAGLRVCGQPVTADGPHLFLQRVADIALIPHLRQRQQAIRCAWIASEHDELALADTLRGPSEVMLGPYGADRFRRRGER